MFLKKIILKIKIYRKIFDRQNNVHESLGLGLNGVRWASGWVSPDQGGYRVQLLT